MNIHQQYQLVELSVSLNSLARVREKIGMHFVDLLHFSMLAEEAGADRVSLYVDQLGWPMLASDVNQLARRTINVFELEVVPGEIMLKNIMSSAVKHVCIVAGSPEVPERYGSAFSGQDFSQIKNFAREIQASGIQVSALIAPIPEVIAAIAASGIDRVRIDCSSFVGAPEERQREQAFARIQAAITACVGRGMTVAVEGKFDSTQVQALANISDISDIHVDELVFAHSLLHGWENTIRDIKALLVKSRLAGADGG